MSTVSEGIPKQRSSESLRVTRRTKAVMIVAAALSLAACTGETTGGTSSDKAPSPKPSATAKANIPTTTALPKKTTTAACLPRGSSEAHIRHDKTGTPQTSLVATKMRIGRHGCYTSIVIPVKGPDKNERPNIHAEYVDQPIKTDTSSKTIFVLGETFLRITLDGVSMHDGQSDHTIPPHTVGQGVINEVRPVGDFENVSTLIAGLRPTREHPFTLTEVTGPNCPVECIRIDIAQ